MDEDGLLTALPGSIDPETGRWRVTAFVTPRLDPGGDQVELAEFPGFADWGEISGQLRLGLEFDSPGLVGTLDLEPDPSSPRPDPALWRTLFADVRVGTGTFQDLSGNSVASFPAAAVAQLVRSTYAAVAESSPTKLPPVTSGPLAVLHQLGEEMARDRDREASDHPMAQLPSSSPPPGSPAGTPGRYVDRDLVGSPTSDPGIGFTIREALRFYDRPGAADPLGPDIEPPPPPRPALDFHAFVSALADYPELLRRLGLALDFLIVDGEQIPAGPGRARFDPFDVPVEWPRRPEARPWTQYEVVDRRFIARPLEGEEELVDGSLRVESSRFFLLEQIDIDGAALKVANTARTIVATRKVVLDSPGSETVAPSMTPDESSLPALRGSGLTLYRDRRARKIVHGWDNAKGQDAQHTAGTELDLFADDVTRGYRLDVAELAEPDTWFSLQARVGAYALRTAVPGERLALPVADPIRPDEGYVKAASASHNAAEPDVAYIHEAIAGWEGWSLAAPRPGNRIGQHRVEPPDDPAAEPAGFPLPLEVTFRPQPGSLPRLRFGRSYRMRARLVDMAGRSVPPDFLDPNHVTPFTTFFRWDPVPAPVVVPRRPFTEGESGLRMVIRSTLDVTAAAYPDLPRITSLAGHTREDLAYRAVNERHLAAPIGSQQLAELHGRFDTAVRASSSTAERDAQFVIAARSAGTLLSPDDAGMITDGKAPPRPVELLIEDGRVVPHANLQGSGEYVLHDVNQLALPYLPDPLASAVSFTTLPGDGDTRVLDWPTDGRWFDRRPVLLRIEEGSGPPQWEPDARQLRVFLPQAEHVRVQLSSVLPREELTSMGVWMLERPAFREQQEEDAAFGRHWMLTPWDRLDLVHAVEKPLAPPVIKVADPPVFNSAVHRFLGETFASLTGTIANHAKSTGRVDLDASWIEPIDDPAQPTPQLTLPGQAHVGDFLLEPTEDECRIARNEFAPGPGRPPTHLVRHEFGDTKHRWVDYQATATTRFREYFPPAITDRELAGEDLIRHPGPALRLNVPSSHRPDPPQIEYVVPTWTWEERQIVGARARLGLGALGLLPTTVRTRIGGGLRVYLSRPWFSSGADELLGVVVRDQPWLTLPVDRDAGLLVSAEASQLADLAAERIIAARLAEGRGAARLGSATRLLAAADAVSAAEPVVLARRTPTEDAQFTAHLAVLEGAGESAPAAVNAARSKVLTGVLDALAANDGVLEAELGGALADALIPQPHLTRWGADPAWAAPPISSGPYIHQFPLRSAVGTKISLPGQEKPATVVGHTPAFDEARGLWYCDLQIEAGSAYQPFVDLALVRYQPYSISGVHASSVVRPGFTQLVPDRTAALTPVALRAAWAVSLRGPSGYNELGQTYLFGSPPAAIVDASRELVAVVQTRPVGSDDLDWRPVGPEVRLHASGDDLADIRWHATVPRPELPPDNENRLVLTEYELFETDISQAETWVDRPAGGFGEARRKPAGRRLVFATEFTV